MSARRERDRQRAALNFHGSTGCGGGYSGYQTESVSCYFGARSRSSGVGGSDCKAHVSYLLCYPPPVACSIYVVSDNNGRSSDAVEADGGPNLSTILAPQLFNENFTLLCTPLRYKTARVWCHHLTATP